ncbi:hypothetical protein PMAYCL1PPCAC_31434 [Pristionchus mayeri]|uniref:Uncharacterized protein n=1 Tax=Pristionchus mayeri TaxID=1317129 RepID=A0AAN5DG84_9BILA|nr:hypothetical protein PMAYCL1PPCAC_31434 [Pristionchus mayeri]
MKDIAYLEEVNQFEVCEYCNSCGRRTRAKEGAKCSQGNVACSERIITLATCKFSQQLKEIIHDGMDEIEEVHIATRRNMDGETLSRGQDLHDFAHFQNCIESKADYESKKIHISLSLCMDAFPLFKKTNYSITPVQIHIRDLKAHNRSLKRNNVIAALIGGSEKPSEVIIDKILSKIRSFIAIGMRMDGWEYRFTLST